MSASIAPGDWLECVDARPYKGSPVPLVLGQRYQIAAVWDAVPHEGTDAGWMDCCVDLVEVPRPEPDIAWGLNRFKPLDGWQPTRRALTEALT